VIIGIFFFFRGIFDYTVGEIRDKLDIKISFKLNADYADINQIKDKISSMPEVKSATLTTSEDALEIFKKNHSNDPVALQALDEIGYNPFPAYLTINAQDITSYETISQSLDSGSEFLGNSYSIIGDINYYKLKSSIDKLNNIVNWINTIGYWITLIFIILSALIVFNTIRLSIFIYKDEISVMKLVGASNMYIRGPFLIEAAIYAVSSSILSMILFWPMTYYLSKKTILFLNGLNIYKYYTDNFLSLFFILLVMSLALSFISCLLAIRRYLKI
jgi:cell division transport system permease protein